jgi:hypothetical protein
MKYDGMVLGHTKVGKKNKTCHNMKIWKIISQIMFQLKKHSAKKNKRLISNQSVDVKTCEKKLNSRAKKVNAII